jgi:hypothetical protein
MKPFVLLKGALIAVVVALGSAAAQTPSSTLDATLRTLRPYSPFAEVLPGTNPQFVLVLLRLADAGIVVRSTEATEGARAAVADNYCRALSYDDAKSLTFVETGRGVWELRTVICSRRV